jgi:hypothetical protein
VLTIVFKAPALMMHHMIEQQSCQPGRAVALMMSPGRHS